MDFDQPAQLDSISRYNYLAASLSDYHNEMQAQKAIVAANMQQANVEKAPKKALALKDKESEEQHLLNMPSCIRTCPLLVVDCSKGWH